MQLELDAQGFPAWEGHPLDLPPKERAVLALLIESSPQLVHKQRFAERAWKGRAMSDESLARSISRIRAALAHARGVRIEAIYGTGYRLQVPEAAWHTRLVSAAQAPPQAVEAYLHARQLAQQRTPRAMARALALLRALVAEHARYAAAHVALAEVLAGAASWGIETCGDIDEAQRHLHIAAQLDASMPGLATAQAFLLTTTWRFAEATPAWQRALASAPNDPETLFLYGRFLLAIGNAHDAVAHLEAAVRLHPYAALLRISLARARAHAGDACGALLDADAACSEHPDNRNAAAYRLGLYAWARPGAAIAQDAWDLAQRPDAPPLALSIHAYALARCGDHDAARAVVDTALGCAGTTACQAVFHVAALLATGETSWACALLQAAEAARCAVLPMVLQDPANAALRTLDDCRALRRRVLGGD